MIPTFCSVIPTFCSVIPIFFSVIPTFCSVIPTSSQWFPCFAQWLSLKSQWVSLLLLVHGQNYTTCLSDFHFWYGNHWDSESTISLSVQKLPLIFSVFHWKFSDSHCFSSVWKQWHESHWEVVVKEWEFFTVWKTKYVGHAANAKILILCHILAML